ncbi:ribosome biogenesis protein NOP53 [Notechis scutatus]|uniref:Ribosome biogenesis protein NOP53 n=1 Tax=Notechis scutatus TaxID=8663 RepID=A0A6J1VM54_9SAUR|nr:ribosome biogenesis protein NOP53 [Notechis scutatus]
MAAPGASPQAAASSSSSSSFLGFSANSRDPSQLPSRRVGGRGARNRKKGWKRWRGPEAKLGRDLGDWLEERVSELRHLGGPVSEKPDESLFFVDTSNEQQGQKEQAAKEKPLKIDLILQPDSKVPPPKDILSYQVPNGRKLKRKQRLWEKLAEKGLVPRKERLLQQRLQNPPKANTAGADSGTDPSREFYDIWADSRAGKTRPLACKSLEGNPPRPPPPPPPPAVASLLAQKARELSEKAARLRKQEIFQLKSIRLQLKQREAELQRRKQRREAERKLEAVKPKRLGRLKYEEPDVDVQLSSELAESLRTLRPEGSILKDRFKSLQKRNIIEPRERAKFKRKYRLKYVEKRAFREIT